MHYFVQTNFRCSIFQKRCKFCNSGSVYNCSAMCILFCGKTTDTERSETTLVDAFYRKIDSGPAVFFQIIELSFAWHDDVVLDVDEPECQWPCDMMMICYVLVAIFVLYFLYFMQLNMFETLRYLGLIGLPTFLCGNKLLSSIAARRFLMLHTYQDNAVTKYCDPRTYATLFADTFYCTSPPVWNSLPPSLQTQNLNYNHFKGMHCLIRPWHYVTIACMPLRIFSYLYY